MNIKEYIGILGFRVKDRVTDYEGVVTSISFDLYGCTQILVNPGMDEYGKLRDSIWFDVGRLDKTSNKPVMKQPDFEYGPVSLTDTGPEMKPSMGKP